MRLRPIPLVGVGYNRRNNYFLSRTVVVVNACPGTVIIFGLFSIFFAKKKCHSVIEPHNALIVSVLRL